MNQEKKTYEGMFLLDAGNPDFQSASEPVRAILDRREAEVLSLKPWEERRLAYAIRGRKRGLYVLTYFKADPQLIVEIEHDCRLDERVVRALILRRDKLTEDEIQAETPATVSARKAAERQRADERRAAEQAAEAEAGSAAPPAEDQAPPKTESSPPAPQDQPARASQSSIGEAGQEQPRDRQAQAQAEEQTAPPEQA